MLQNIQAEGLPDSLHEVLKTSSRRAAQCCSCGRWGLSAANSEVQWPSAALCPGKFSRAESKQHWQLAGHWVALSVFYMTTDFMILQAPDTAAHILLVHTAVLPCKFTVAPCNCCLVL